MTNDLLTTAKAREEQLASSLSASIGADVSVSVDDDAQSAADVKALAETGFAAHVVGTALDCIVLVSEADANALAGTIEADGLPIFLQSLATGVTNALIESGEQTDGISAKISSPGETEASSLSGRHFVRLRVQKDDAVYSISIATNAEASPAQSETPGAIGIPLPELGASGIRTAAGGSGLGLLADVEVDVTVELGRRRLPINELLTLTRGSIIELEKLVGEPLEVYVNNRLIADGEAVVIDEQFGIRITNIIPSAQRSLDA